MLRVLCLLKKYDVEYQSNKSLGHDDEQSLHYKPLNGLWKLEIKKIDILPLVFDLVFTKKNYKYVLLFLP